MPVTVRGVIASGWLPAAILAVFAAAVLAAYDTPVAQVAIFGAYVAFGLTLPGMLWVRLLRGRAAHIAEDLALGLAAGYCLELATYIPVRALGVPLAFLAWPIATLVLFAAIPRLRPYWQGNGERAPGWWSWSLAGMLGYLIVYSGGIFFAQHHVTGADTPLLDMPYHLALLGELKHHVPPDIPYVTGVPLAYHWFFYAEAAATSWATGIEPVVLLYRLSLLPMFVVFTLLTAAAARRLTGGWWSGPVAAGMALFGTVAGPYLWTDVQRMSLGIKATPVWDTQTLLATWTSPTNLFGLALFAAALLVFIDLFAGDARRLRSEWLLAGLLVFGVAGAKASLLPLLIVGMAIVLVGAGVRTRRIHRGALLGFGMAAVGLVVATVVLFRGETDGLVLGIRGLQSFPIAVSIAARSAHGLAAVLIPLAVLAVALVLWSLLWAGAYGMLARWRVSSADPRILLLAGVGAAGVGAVVVFLYPGLSQLWYLRGAVGAFALLTVAGMAHLLPERTPPRRLVTILVATALVGAAVVTVVNTAGRSVAPKVGQDHLPTILVALFVPLGALLAMAGVTYLVAGFTARRSPLLAGAAPLLVVALAMGFSLPNVTRVLASPFDASLLASLEGGPAVRTIPAEAIDVARWLRNQSDPNDLVVTNLHCRSEPPTPDLCDARHFWVSAYTERHILVEGWSYTPAVGRYAASLDIPLSVTNPFWDSLLLATNDRAFSDPSPATLASLRERFGVRWLYADLTRADPAALGAAADLRYRLGNFAVYALR